ncbi:hypothetical protein [Streptomyces pseudogriseolus]|uniref:hypothetical protein n=1 Tax=Streptomyces pseudogriseolus TaxID=36817 RepID=UPI00369EAE50
MRICGTTWRLGADYPGPFGLPWRENKRPYGHSALKTAAACLKGFYLHLGIHGVNPALAEALRVTKLPTRADRRRAMLGHVLHSMPTNPLALAERVRRHPKMLPEGAREMLLGAVSCARDRMVVTWLADGGFRIGELRAAPGRPAWLCSVPVAAFICGFGRQLMILEVVDVDEK